MNKNLLLIFCCFLTSLTQAQIHEVGIWGGGANFMGDIGKTTYVSPNKLALGFIYKFNKSPRLTYRFSYIHGKIAGFDDQSDISSRNERDYSFKNKTNEFNAGLEFNFFEFDLHQLKRQITPFISSGIIAFRYDELYFNNGTQRVDGGKWGFGIPMIVGVKGNITKQLILGFEIGARYTYTDNLDGSNPSNENLAGLSFGNINSNDWYTFTGFTLTYTFGENPCFCPH
uniref:type IX secretion system protein PorG n=1 Tax=Flavobacterium sp. TaxID=239 RepID=UPI00404B8EA3